MAETSSTEENSTHTLETEDKSKIKVEETARTNTKVPSKRKYNHQGDGTITSTTRHLP
jgi:hypothetical protein